MTETLNVVLNFTKAYQYKQYSRNQSSQMTASVKNHPHSVSFTAADSCPKRLSVKVQQLQKKVVPFTFSFLPYRSDDSDDFAKLSDVRTWCSIDCGTDQAAPPRFPFTGGPGMKVDVEHNNPLAYLQLFLIDEVIEKIVKETNRYKEQQSATLHRKFSRSRKWEPVTKNDIWNFLGLIILQGVVKKPLQKWYWSTNKLLETPFFGTVMTEYRFSLIMKFLHFTNNEEFYETTHPAPKLKKIWEVFQMVVKNFQQTYVPERDISIDESLMAYKGRLSWIQYIASKRAQFGIKSYMLCLTWTCKKVDDAFRLAVDKLQGMNFYHSEVQYLHWYSYVYSNYNDHIVTYLVAIFYMDLDLERIDGYVKMYLDAHVAAKHFVRFQEFLDNFYVIFAGVFPRKPLTMAGNDNQALFSTSVIVLVKC
ncbi:uncharacterized protein ACMZJ9_001207 [Mantella aurantiaca]